MDFTSALETKASEVEKPVTLPQGTYTWVVTKVPTQETNKSGEWNIVEFPIKAVAAEEDVDADDLNEFGSLDSAFSRVSFMFPTDPDKENDVKKTLYRMKNFMQNTLAVDCDEDSSLKEMMAASVNCQFLGSCVWREYEGETYFDVKNYAPLD